MMYINIENINLNENNRLLLKNFFDDNFDFIINNSFIEYDNIKTLADLYEIFIDENNLRENDILMLFLAELRYDQLSYKICKDTNKMKVERMKRPINRLNKTINKWYQKTKETIPVSQVKLANLDMSIKQKIKQDSFEQQCSIEEAKRYIVK